jgi:photosystem II stability/assembly factor-like uncharacterized protein
MKNIKQKLSSLLFFLSVLLFIIAFNFSDNPVGNWYQQFLPNLPNFQVSDIYFLDSLTGWAVTGNTNSNDTSGYILKTTNGGDNWTLKFTDVRDFSRVKFLTADTGFVTGGYGNGARIYKSSDGGDNWSPINIPGGGQIYFNDMSVLNQDTIWVVTDNFLLGGVYRTTDGGQNWIHPEGFQPNRIYMFNRNLGFISSSGLKRTIDGGITWSQIPSQNGFMDMYFIDSLTGWKANGDMKKTTDGGFNWVTQTLPYGGNIITTGISRFSNVSRDTIWGVGGWVFYPGNGNRGMVYRTTNGGTNWLYQIPDTSIRISVYLYNKFINRQKGWAYAGTTGIHTTTGGDTTFLVPISQTSSQIPKEYKLFQNYPNPFNYSSKFKVLITSNVKRQTSDVKVKVYDITGREVLIVLDKKLSPGEYEITFDAKELPSGVYFYSLIVDGSVIDTKKAILLK